MTPPWERHARRPPVTVTREELHGRVWGTPMALLAREYGLSDRGLAKICRRLEVPYPSRGHWQRLAAGQMVKRLPLPGPSASTPRSVEITPSPSIARPPTSVGTPESVPPARLVVPKRLSSPHPALRPLLFESRDRNSSSLERRWLRILDALLKGLDREGFKVLIASDTVRVERNASIEFSIEELQIRRPLAEAEREPPTASGRVWKSRTVPSGRLVLAVTNYHFPADLPRRWSETHGRILDYMLSNVVETFLAADLVLRRRFAGAAAS